MTLTVRKVKMKQRGTNKGMKIQKAVFDSKFAVNTVNGKSDDKCFHRKFCTNIKAKFINNLDPNLGANFLIEKLSGVLSDKGNNAESDVHR